MAARWLKVFVVFTLHVRRVSVKHDQLIAFHVQRMFAGWELERSRRLLQANGHGQVSRNDLLLLPASLVDNVSTWQGQRNSDRAPKERRDAIVC